jgi:hypothetical protein
MGQRDSREKPSRLDTMQLGGEFSVIRKPACKGVRLLKLGLKVLHVGDFFVREASAIRLVGNDSHFP